MQVSLSLIKSFGSFNLPPSKIGETLTLLGIEVDRIINEHPPFSGVVIGDVISVRPHPNANKLQVATVSDGIDTFQVVCGAPNCREGLKTAFAKIGACLKGSQGKPLIIEKNSIRSVESYGMLCSEAELSLSDRNEEICELPREMETGSDLLPFLWDPIFELSLTPNLGHCMSALGIARELSAALQIPLKKPKASLRENGEALEKKIKVSVEDKTLCPRYMCRSIEGIKVAPSPGWLQRQLLGCGINPISNVVDITNFICIKWGQPLHAFDLGQLKGPYLSVAPSSSKQIFTGLDGQPRQLPADALLISDAEGPVAIAGILGGQASSVTEKTQSILLEAAYFDPISIRKTAKKIGIRTESSHRFEKGTDPLGIPDALNEACSLILQLCGGRLSEGTIDIKADSLSFRQILCRPNRINKIIGTSFSLNEIENIFGRLGFTTFLTPTDDFLVDVPLFRSDIHEEIDLIEEVARIYGYNNLEKKTALYAASKIPHDPGFLFEKEVRKRLVGLGLQEFLTSDLISPKLSSLAQELVKPQVSYLQALYAKSEEYSVLRPSLLPGLIQIVKGNLDHKNQTLNGFEIGRIHFLEQDQLVELPMAALLLTGKRDLPHWSRKINEVDFYDLKGLLENLFEGLQIAHFYFELSTHLSFHPYAQANIYSKDLLIGSFGQLHPEFLEKLGIKQRLFFAEINLRHLQNIEKKSSHMHPIPFFPSSERDWTVSIPFRSYAQEILSKINSFYSPLLVKAEILDIYIPEDHLTKNVTFRFTYRDLFKTVSFEEVETEHNKLIQSLSKLLAK